MKTNIVSRIQKTVALRMLMFCLLCSVCLLNSAESTAKPASTTSVQSAPNLQVNSYIMKTFVITAPCASTVDAYDTGGGTIANPGPKKVD